MVFVTASPLIRFMSDIAGDNQYEGELFSISRWPFRIRVLIRLTGSDHSVVNVLPFAPWSALLVWRWRWGFLARDLHISPRAEGQRRYVKPKATISLLPEIRRPYLFCCTIGRNIKHVVSASSDFYNCFISVFTFTLTFVLHLWSRL